jgi:hypothetical protein
MQQATRDAAARRIRALTLAAATVLSGSISQAQDPTEVPSQAALDVVSALDGVKNALNLAATAAGGDTDAYFESLLSARTQLQRATDALVRDPAAFRRVRPGRVILNRLRVLDRPLLRLVDPNRPKPAAPARAIARISNWFRALDGYMARALGMTRVELAALNAAQQAPPAPPAAPPLPKVTPQAISEHKSGISLKVFGTYGIDYLVENWYHDPRIDPRCVVYLRADTKFNFVHNAQNIVNFRPETATLVGPEVGTIRYRVDQEYGRRGVWTNGWGSGAFPAWPGPRSFDALEIAAGVPVVGSLGPVPGVTPNNTTCSDGTFYWRGVQDAFNDEWHVVAVADDDAGVSASLLKGAGGPVNTVWQGDGKVYYFVIAPSTPSISIIPRDTPSQFYTTPAKVYFVPKIHTQTTFVSGKCNLEIAALGDAKCRYSLVPLGEAASWQDYADPIDLATLAADTKYELSYRIGESGPIKTRLLHYNPAFPSDAETHPNDILWKGTEGLDAIKARINDPNPTTPNRHLYGEIYRSSRDYAFMNGEDPPYAIPLLDGRRTRPQFGLPSSAQTLLIEGLGKYPNKEQVFHDSMLDNTLGLDPVGDELVHFTGTPCMELMQAGGYSTGDLAVSMALGYDWHIKSFRRGLTLRGFTAVEDYKIRDIMASFVHATMIDFSHPYQVSIDANGFDKGMWSTAWLANSMMVAAVMPEYDTPYFGTSGAPKGSQPSPRTWAPWKDQAHSWWEVSNSKTITPLGAPNLTKKTGIYGLINETPVWNDRAGYFNGDHLMGHVYYFLMNFRANYDGHHYEHLDKAMLLAATGELPAPVQTDEGNCIGLFPSMVNHHFPTIAAKLDPILTAGDRYKDLWKHPGGLFLYEDDWATR